MRFWLCYVISLGAFVLGVYLAGVDTIAVFEEARKALSWVGGFNRLVWCSGALLLLLQVVYTLKELDNRAEIAQNIVVALLPPIYALLTSLSFTLPVMIILKNKLGER
jgi:hypothetical protein